MAQPPTRTETLTVLYGLRAGQVAGLVTALATGQPAWLLLVGLLLLGDAHIDDYLRDHWGPS